MKKIILLLLIGLSLIAGVIKAPLLTYDEEKAVATIKVTSIDVGMSGFIVHNIAPNHNTTLKDIVVIDFNKETQIATLKISEYNGLRNNALPTGNWRVEVGDTAMLAFGYTRALLIAPSEEIYYRISKSVKIQWLHPDIFATILSFEGHPTPLKEDFELMSNASSIGLIFFYLENRVYTLDAKSFAILSISDAPLTQDNVVLPFYTRIDNIDEAWWGEGSNPLEEYAPHYYELLVEHNKQNKKLYEIIEKSDENIHYLLDDFELGDK